MRRIIFFFSLLSLASYVHAENTEPNVVLILADDLGWADTTLYGKTSFYETPNIERLASRGMTFNNAYSCPICSPTRASILTGQTPARHGITAPAAHLAIDRPTATTSKAGPPHQKSTNVQSATRLDTELPTLGKIIKAAGYQTAHFGKWHLGREGHTPLEHGFDVDLPHWYGPGPKNSYLSPWGYPEMKDGPDGEHIEDRMAQEAVKWLKARDKTKPFFLNYWQFSVHGPFGAKPELIEYYRQKLRRGEAHQSPTYAAMVHSLDDAVGTLLDALESEGISDNTIIIFYSDNGGNMHSGLEETDAEGATYITRLTSNHPLRGGKGNIHEGGIRVPAVISWPGVTKPGSINQSRVQSNDLYPTLLEMLGIDFPKDHSIDGVNFTKALRGEVLKRPPMFTYLPSHGNTPHWLPPAMSVHYGDWKLIRIFHYGDEQSHDYRLYNLRTDISESQNLAMTNPEIVEDLDTLIDQYLNETEIAIPAPNPNFDISTFDASRIGVQAGGLKMSGKSKPSDSKDAPPAKSSMTPPRLLLGWTVRNGTNSVLNDYLQIAPVGRQAFIANSKVETDGPAVLRIRMQSHSDGAVVLQWREEGQDTFPKEGQRISIDVKKNAWMEINATIPTHGRIIHLRLYTVAGKGTTKINWIEFGSKSEKALQRWDFKFPKPSPASNPK